jgi:hypothetical protein
MAGEAGTRNRPGPVTVDKTVPSGAPHRWHPPLGKQHCGSHGAG